MTVSMLFAHVLPLLLALVAGAAAGGLTAWWLIAHSADAPAQPEEPEPPSGEADPFVDAEIDRASVRWAEASNQPPGTAGLMAARLKTLNKIGTGKGWFS
jgi:hypothetical protein